MYLQLMVIGELGVATIRAVKPVAVVNIKGSGRAITHHHNMEENNVRGSNVRIGLVIPALVPVSMQMYLNSLPILDPPTNIRSTCFIFLCSMV